MGFPARSRVLDDRVLFGGRRVDRQYLVGKRGEDIVGCVQ
jgi:hypothetical protein